MVRMFQVQGVYAESTRVLPTFEHQSCETSLVHGIKKRIHKCDPLASTRQIEGVVWVYRVGMYHLRRF